MSTSEGVRIVEVDAAMRDEFLAYAREHGPAHDDSYLAPEDVAAVARHEGQALAELARVLKPGGIAILADFSPEGLEIVARVHREDGREHPVTGATPESAAALLSTRGFAVEARLSGHNHDVVVLVK